MPGRQLGAEAVGSPVYLASSTWWQPVLCGVNTLAAWSSDRFYVADSAVLKLSVLHSFCIYSVRKEGKTGGNRIVIIVTLKK